MENSDITSITVNGKAAYELNGKFLDDLRDNAFSGTKREDAEANNNDEHEIAEIFRIETNLFDYETPLCTEFKEFNYLLKVDMNLFTHDIERTKTFEDYKSKLNNEIGEPWSKDGVPYEICDHICDPFRFKNGKTKWSAYNSNEDGFCNSGELPRMVRVGYMTYFQDYEWYDDLMDNRFEEALKQKAIYEKSWGDATQSVINFCAWLKRSFENFHELDYELLEKLQERWNKFLHTSLSTSGSNITFRSPHNTLSYASSGLSIMIGGLVANGIASTAISSSSTTIPICFSSQLLLDHHLSFAS
ncbi:hypothetical protein Tco_0935409 [Tanacetum coccineum]